MIITLQMTLPMARNRYLIIFTTIVPRLPRASTKLELLSSFQHAPPSWVMQGSSFGNTGDDVSSCGPGDTKYLGSDFAPCDSYTCGNYCHHLWFSVLFLRWVTILHQRVTSNFSYLIYRVCRNRLSWNARSYSATGISMCSQLVVKKLWAIRLSFSCTLSIVFWNWIGRPLPISFVHFIFFCLHTARSNKYLSKK